MTNWQLKKEWWKRNKNHKLYKILVILGIVKCPVLELEKEYMKYYDNNNTKR